MADGLLVIHRPPHSSEMDSLKSCLRGSSGRTAESARQTGEDSEHDDHRQYSVFMSNRASGFLTEYGYRWKIESGYKSIKRFMTATTSTDFGRRFFYFGFACLLYSCTLF